MYYGKPDCQAYYSDPKITHTSRSDGQVNILIRVCPVRIKMDIGLTKPCSLSVGMIRNIEFFAYHLSIAI